MASGAHGGLLGRGWLLKEVVQVEAVQDLAQILRGSSWLILRAQ